MERVFNQLLYTDLRCYLDDIFAKSMTVDEHFRLLEKIFIICQQNSISLKLSKCKFFVREFVYLGFKFQNGKISPNPKKVEDLLKKATPRNVKELRSFIGMVEYFARFLPNLAKDLIPLLELLKKNAFWEWTSKCQKCVERIKDNLTNAPCLKIIDNDHDVVVSTDASKYALGVCIEQYDDNQVLHPVSYFSKSFKDLKRIMIFMRKNAWLLLKL
jgi:hypothetical protein